MSDGLKPCPFCGKTASLINCPEEWNEGAVVVACDGCGGSAPVVFGVKDDPNPHARELWNTRPIEDALQARIVELEAENTALRAELVRWLETLTGTPLEALWELREPRMRQVSIQVNKKDYEAARKRLEELNNGNDSKG